MTRGLAPRDSKIRKYEMNDSIISDKILTLILGFLFIGGGATILGIMHASKSAVHSPGYVVQESDGDVFVYGAHA
jgi:hypothetical protein